MACWHSMLAGRWRVCWLGADCVYWRHAYVMMTSSLSGSGMWVGSFGIRVESAHPGEEDACDAWRASVRVGSNGAWGHFRRPISTRFSTVASSLPPLHSGMVKTQFWQLSFLSKIKHPFKPCALIPIVGEFRLPHARTGGVLILAQRRVKHTNTIFYVVRQNRLHPRERVIVLDIKIHGGGGLHLLLLQLLQWQQGCCHCSSLFLSTLTFSLSALSLIFALKYSLLYRHFMVNMEGPIALKHGMNCGTIHATTCLVVGYCHKWQYPNRAEARRGEGSQDTDEDEGFWGTENEREGHEQVGRTLKTRE